jgi:hypothetical protein
MKDAIPRLPARQRVEDLRGAVAAAVIDEQDLEVLPRGPRQHRAQLTVERGKVLPLVVDGDDDGNHLSGAECTVMRSLVACRWLSVVSCRLSAAHGSGRKVSRVPHAGARDICLVSTTNSQTTDNR